MLRNHILEDKVTMPNIEPRTRHSHVAVQLEHYILVFGGTWRKDTILQEPLHDIWIYNLYTEQWRKQVITDRKAIRPGTANASATVIESDVYMFGGYVVKNEETLTNNSLWKLTRTPTGCFTWDELKSKSRKESPSPRSYHSAWQYANKLWIFGGSGPALINPSNYLNNYGDYSRHNVENNTENNQILCFDPSCQEWTNPRSFGDIPGPRSRHGTASIKHKVWLFGGANILDNNKQLDELYELDMHSLTWTMIEKYCEVKPYYRNFCTLTSITENQLVMHHGRSKMDAMSKSYTWILDLSMMSWKEYLPAVDKDDGPRVYHTCTQGLNRSVMIIGGISGYYQPQPWKNVHMALEAKSLKQRAIRTIWQHKNALPWRETLPKKLRSLFGFPGDFQVQHDDTANTGSIITDISCK